MSLKFFTPAVTFSLLGALALGTIAGGAGGYVYETRNQPAVVATQKDTATYLTSANAADLLSAKVSDGTIASAAPSKPVLLVMCAHAACESAALDKVTASMGDKVTVLALDPYAEQKLAHSVESDLAAPAILQSIAMQGAVSVLQQNKVEPTAENVQQIMQNPMFQMMVRQQASSTPLLAPVYPKVFFFSDKDFKMVSGAIGLTSEAQLEKFATAGLDSMKQMQAAEAEAMKAEADAAKAAITPDLKALATTPAPAAPAAKDATKP
jgi:hypothetical protein